MVSVIIPILNEEKYIKGLVFSLINQDYPKNDMEWIFVDGCSSDNSLYMLEYLLKDRYNYRILNNPYKYTPYALNIGIKHSLGKYIIRLDAHAEYAFDYISRCVHYLDVMDVENVGGVLTTKAKTNKGKIIASLLSSKFGVGNSKFRINGSGYVDTVPFGAFRREIFRNVGGYDERLIRNQDNELNYRIRKNGGKIFLSKDIHLSYYCRETIFGLMKMALKNGQWNIITMKLCPGSMGMRHFIPLIFDSSILILAIIGVFFWPSLLLLLSVLLLYFMLDFYYSFKISSSFKSFLSLFFIFPLFHVTYGIGSFLGMLKILSPKYKTKKYSPLKI